MEEMRSDHSGSNYSDRSSTIADLVKDYHGTVLTSFTLVRMIANALPALSDMMDDQEVTPKASKKTPRVPRTISAGEFLKKELYRKTMDVEAEPFSVRGQGHPKMYDYTQDSYVPPSPTRSAPPAPQTPSRRSSKSKNFFLRAIGVKNGDDSPKNIRRTGSAASRRIVRKSSTRGKRVQDDPLLDEHQALTNYSMSRKSSDIADVNLNSRIYSQHTSSTPSPGSSPGISMGHPGAFVLCPQVTVTPEVASVETDACSIWVAILITGALQRADGYKTNGTFSESYHETLLGLSIPLLSANHTILIGIYRSFQLWSIAQYAY